MRVLQPWCSQAKTAPQQLKGESSESCAFQPGYCIDTYLRSCESERQHSMAIRQSLASDVVKLDATFNNMSTGTVTVMTGEGLIAAQWHSCKSLWEVSPNLAALGLRFKWFGNVSDWACLHDLHALLQPWALQCRLVIHCLTLLRLCCCDVV